jgi:acyl-CoA thioester hydrolase
VEHRVSFHETDAMGVVHHANYLRFFEQARVIWLEEHDRPYADYIAMGLHFAVTRAEIDHLLPARFDDRLVITTWADWVRGASLRMAYLVDCEGQRLASGATEHAAFDIEEGRVRRIPPEARMRLMALVSPDSPAHP